MTAGDRDEIAVVVLGMNGLENIGWRNGDRQAYGFLFMCERVLTRDGVVGAPVGKQAMAVCPTLLTLDMRDTYKIRSGAYLVGEVETFRYGNSYVHFTVTVSCDHRVAGSECARLGFWCWFPVQIGDLNDATERPVHNDALAAAVTVREAYGLFAVPTVEGSDAYAISHSKYIVAVAGSQLSCVGIELCVVEFQLPFALTIDVDRLSWTAIETVSSELTLQYGTMLMDDREGIGTP